MSDAEFRPPIGLMNIDDDVGWIEQHDQMLRQIRDGPRRFSRFLDLVQCHLPAEYALGTHFSDSRSVMWHGKMSRNRLAGRFLRNLSRLRGDF
jgi:hypothetical protein